MASSSAIEPLPDRVLLYTDDGDAASHGIHERGLVPESVLVRRSTLEDVFLHLTGPEPHRMSSLALALRPLEFFFTQYKRVWRGTAVTSVVTPVVYLLALGVGLGVFVDRSADLAAASPTSSSSLPGLMAATAMQLATFESTWPVLRRSSGIGSTTRCSPRPLRVRDILLGHQSFFAFRLLLTATVYLVVITAFGAVSSPLGILAIPVTVLVGLSFAAPIAAWAAHTETEVSFVAIFRFVILPMFLFSGTFFPISSLPAPLEVIAYATPLWHGVTLCRDLTLGDVQLARGPPAPRRICSHASAVGLALAAYHLPAEAGRMTELVARARLTVPAKPAFGGLLIVERNAMVYRRTWMILFSGFFEPLFYLFFFVYPLERFIGDVTFAGETIEYAAFVAPALLASSAMNGAFYDATNVFWKLRYGKVYDSILATPVGPKDVAVGETIWAVVRAMLYSAAFLLVIVALGLVESWWALLALPACFVIGFGFAGAGIAAVTWMRNWKDFDLIQLIMLPMFMFSATFYPISVYPEVLEWIVRCLPLYHGIELVRSLTTGAVGAMQLVNVAYLATMGLVGMAIASRRIDKLLLK